MNLAAILGLFSSAFSSTTPADPAPAHTHPIATDDADPASRIPSKGARVYLIADFLYWNAEEEGLDFSYSAKSAGPTLPLFDAKILEYKSEWKPGFRVGLGYRLPHDLWEAKAYVTQLRTTNHLDKSAHSDGFIQPNFGQLPEMQSFSHLNGNWHLKYTLFDVLLCRTFAASKAFTLTPFFGARAAWIHQSLHDKFSEPIEGTSSLELHAKSRYAAAGVRIGSDVNFYLARYFSFFGQASASLLSGRFQLHTDLFSDTHDKLFSAEGKPHRLAANCDLRAGMSGTIPLYRKQAYLTLGLTYDMSIWFAQNQLLNFFSAPNAIEVDRQEGNLTLQGISFCTRLDF